MKSKKIGIIFIVFFLVGVGLIFFFTRNMRRNEPELKTKVTIAPTIPPTLTPTLTPTPTQTAQPVTDKYPVHKHIYATMFWVGEKATRANDYIPNESSAWDSHWLDHFGGVDNPYSRKGYYPEDFKPKENPFYFALPYDDMAEDGRKANAVNIPWYNPALFEDYSQIKNRWVKIRNKDRVCYAQWEDVGPFEEDDFSYVFGNGKPTDKRAGIDLSPATHDCLHIVTNAYVDWNFVDDTDVPNGPWKEIITTSQTSW